MRQGSINFFSTKNSTPPYLQAVDPYLVPITMLIVGIVTLAGAGVIAAYVIFSATKANYERQKQEAVDYLRTTQQKEQTYAFIRNRIQAIQTVQKVQKSYAPYIDTALAIAQPPTLKTFGLTDRGEVHIQVSFSTIEEGQAIIQKVMDLAARRVIRNQMLTSVDYPSQGLFVISLTYNVTGSLR
jgi:flagellar basal body-associated protein FliL